MTARLNRDVIFAAVAIAAGLAGLWLTADYRPRARHFPQAMSAVIALSGVAILIEGWLRGRRGPAPAAAPRERASPDAGPDTPPPDAEASRRAERAGVLRGALPFAAILAVWALAVSYGAGYLLPGFLTGCAMMAIAGARRPLPIVAGAAGVVLFCFTMFYIVFQTRIPETEIIRSLVAPLRQLF